MLKKIQILLVSLFLLGSTSVYACGMGEMTDAGYENAPITHAYNHWKQGDKTNIPFVFLDVRTDKEFNAGHIPGAMHIPVSALENRLAEVPKGKQVYVYCESGVRAAKASALLAKAGFNVENLPESMRGWRDAGYPVER